VAKESPGPRGCRTSITPRVRKPSKSVLSGGHPRVLYLTRRPPIPLAGGVLLLTCSSTLRSGSRKALPANGLDGRPSLKILAMVGWFARTVRV
jgi:hypothetical protein